MTHAEEHREPPERYPDTNRAELALIVIAGPQASGKSTVATALGDTLRRRGERVALVELDQIAAMALPTLPSWDAAHQIFESVTAQWLRAGLTCVVAEGSGSRNEVMRLLDGAPQRTVTVTVVTTVDLETAFSRAQRDPSRGISRDYDFLSDVYRRWAIELTQIPADLIVNTALVDLGHCVERVCSALTTARNARTNGIGGD